MRNNNIIKERTLSKKMTTSIERSFRRISVNIPGVPSDRIFVEVLMHFIVFKNEDGTIASQKLDKQIMGQLYRAMKPEEPGRSLHGEIMYTFPGGEETVRLIGLGIHYDQLVKR